MRQNLSTVHECFYARSFSKERAFSTDMHQMNKKTRCTARSKNAGSVTGSLLTASMQIFMQEKQKPSKDFRVQSDKTFQINFRKRADLFLFCRGTLIINCRDPEPGLRSSLHRMCRILKNDGIHL